MDDETGQFTIGSASFDSLGELVLYYENNPLYRKMKLKYAISDELLQNLTDGTSQLEDLYAYYTPINTSKKVCNYSNKMEEATGQLPYL